MLSELFEVLPEAGDLDRPKLVFFFDEAHTLFSDTPKALVQKIKQVMKLIRSKGVGIYFVTQSPGDIPGSVLSQLSNRVQHTLWAYTPGEQKAVKAEAQRKKLEKALAREEAQRQRAVERRKAQLERQLINVGAQVLKRGLMGTLFGGRR